MAVAFPESILSQALLEKLRSRAAGYDRDNRFFQEDFNDLREAGYLRMAIPREHGGLGLTLAQAARETRRLAHYRADGAGAQHAHLLGGRRRRHLASGDKSVEWILEDAAAGEVFAAGHAESGNETSIVMSITKAEKRGWRLQVHGPEVIRQPDAGLDAARHARHGYQRSGEPQGHSRRSCRATRPA